LPVSKMFQAGVCVLSLPPKYVYGTHYINIISRLTESKAFTKNLCFAVVSSGTVLVVVNGVIE
jgi:hypothetical protein